MSDTLPTPTSPPAVKTTSPLPTNRLKQICTDACQSTLSSVDTYTHSNTESWNNNIINHILRSLISETAPPATPSVTPFKFAVNSTIIQSNGESKGRRGMHSACGGYWNTEKDGMYAFKYDAKGMDVVVSIIWISVVENAEGRGKMMS